MLYMRVVVKKCYSLNVGTFGNLKVKYFSWKWYQISRLFCIIFSSSSFIILTIVSFKSCKISIQTPFSFKKYLSYYMRTSTILLFYFFCQWWRMEIPITMATMMMERYWFRSSCSLSLCLFFRLEQNRFYPDRNQKLVSIDDESTIRYVFAAR